MIKPFSEMTQEMVFLISTFKLWVVLDVAFGHHLFFLAGGCGTDCSRFASSASVVSLKTSLTTVQWTVSAKAPTATCHCHQPKIIAGTTAEMVDKLQ